MRRTLPRCQARAGSLPAMTFSGMRGRSAARFRVRAHLGCPQWELPGPRATQQTSGPRSRQPRAPRAHHRPAKRSRRRRHLGPLQRGHRSRRPLRRQRILNLAIAGRRVRGRGEGEGGGGFLTSGRRTSSPCYSSRRGNQRLFKSKLRLSVAVTTPNYLIALVLPLVSPKISCAARLCLDAPNLESSALLHAFVQQYFPTWSGGRTPSLQRIAII